MAVPKKKVSKLKRNNRRAHDKISYTPISFDSVTGEPKLPHHLSLKDGYYNGKQLVKLKNAREDGQKVKKILKKDFSKKKEDK